MELIRPPRLYPGDCVTVVAASGPVNKEKFSAGIEALGGRYNLSYDESALFARKGFLAGEDVRRLDTLNSALRDSDCRAIILARGGYGLTRILPGVDQLALRANPKVIVGYSDATVLLSVCVRVGVAAIHGPMISDFGELSEGDRNLLFNLLENPVPGKIFTGLETLVDGKARGPLLGGNLEVLSRLLGTPFQPNFEGTVLFLEEVGESPYRVDRLLTHLEMAGVFDGVAGILIGDFTDCDEPGEGLGQDPGTRDVLVERLGRLAVPVTLGGPFGHGNRRGSLPYGVTVELDGDQGILTAVEGAVS